MADGIGAGGVERWRYAPVPRQIGTLARSTMLELGWGLPGLNRELASWKRRADRIPDEGIRTDAMHVLNRKTGHIAGAAIFSTLPDRRNPKLLQALVAFQTI